MSLLKSGKIYNIKVMGYPNDFTSKEKCLELFIKEYKRVTGITDSKYTTIVTNGGFTYFLLPYINSPSEDIQLALGFGNTYYSTYDNSPYNSFRLLGIHKNSSNTSGLQFTSIPAQDYNEEIKDGINNVSNKSTLHWSIAYSNGEDRLLGVWFQIDTRFLDSHGFYTINSVSFGNGKNYVAYTPDTEVKFSPSFFVCDLIDQTTGEHYDGIARMPNGIFDCIYGICPSKDKKAYQQNIFRPQFYTKQDNSIEFQRLQFGRWKSDNLYITDVSKYEKLKQLSDLKEDKSNGWYEKAFKTPIGDISLGEIYNSQWGRTYIDLGWYAPAIINGDFAAAGESAGLPLWTTGSDEEITKVIQDYYKGKIELEDIKKVWKVGDARKVLLSAMPETYYMKEKHREQEVEMVILGFSDDCISNYSYEEGSEIHNTKGLMTIQQKDCLMDADCAAGKKYGKYNTENGSLSCKREYLTGTLTPIEGWDEFDGAGIWLDVSQDRIFYTGNWNDKTTSDHYEVVDGHLVPANFAGDIPPNLGPSSIWHNKSKTKTYSTYLLDNCISYILKGNTWEKVNLNNVFYDGYYYPYSGYEYSSSARTGYFEFFGQDVFYLKDGTPIVYGDSVYWGTTEGMLIGSNGISMSCELKLIREEQPATSKVINWTNVVEFPSYAKAPDSHLGSAWTDHRGDIHWVAAMTRQDNGYWKNTSWKYVNTNHDNAKVHQIMKNNIFTTEDETYLAYGELYWNTNQGSTYECFRVNLDDFALEQIYFKNAETGEIMNIVPDYIWSDGKNNYYSYKGKHYIFDTATRYETISAYRDRWCNEIYYNALPGYLRKLIQETNIDTKKMKVFLTGPTYTNLGKNINYDHLYYKDKNNWIKLPRYDENILTAYWTDAESGYENDRTMVMIDTENNIIRIHDDTIQKYGIAPAMCL